MSATRPTLFVTLLLLLSTVLPAQPPEGLPPLVTASWLQAQMEDPDLVILHVAFNRRDYAREHIPGARFIWFSWLSPSTPDGSTELAPTADAQRVLEELGITDRSKIVVYFTGNTLATTTRTIFSLLYYGFEGRVALLDGGIGSWKRAGGSVTKDAPVVQKTSMPLSPRPALVADAEYVRRHLADPTVTIIDARAKNFYEGSGGGPRPGHVKGAISLPFSSITDSLGEFKDRKQIESIFAEAGVRKGSTVVAYCHVGQQATVVLLAARMLGFPVRLYDGSFEEWSSLDDDRYPVEMIPPAAGH